MTMAQDCPIPRRLDFFNCMTVEHFSAANAVGMIAALVLLAGHYGFGCVVFNVPVLPVAGDVFAKVTNR